MAKFDLAAIVAATTAGSFVHVNAKDKEVTKAVKDGLIELNTTITNEAGEVAARATPAGIVAGADAVGEQNTASEAGNAPAAAVSYQTFRVAADVVPEVKRNVAPRPLKYPFDKLAGPVTNADGKVEYDSFFVAPTADMPEPWEGVKPTASLAQRRYAEVVGEKPGKNSKGEDIMRKEYNHTRKFRVVEYTHDGVKGALVTRTQ